MKTKPVLAAASAALALALAPSAFAQDYCVADAACVTAGGTDEATLQDALAAADGTIEADRVLIGPGTYTAPDTVGFFATLHPVEVIGSGSGSTVLTGPPDTDTVLSLGQGSSVSALGLVIPANTTNATKVGLHLVGASATRVKVTADPALSAVGIGIFPGSGAVIEDSEVDLTMTPATVVGISAQHDTTVRRSVISARSGMNAQGSHVHFERDLVRAKSTGLNVVNSANDIDATDSVIQMTGLSTGVSAATLNSTDSGITLRGDTIVGDGTPGSVGVTSASSKPFTATVNIDSSIVRGFPIPAKRVAVGTGATADLSIQYSDLNAATAISTGAGTLALGPGNISADPLFAGGSDFRLLTGSPAVDAGNPADLGDTADLDGNGRVVDSDGDGIARRDIGAFESPAAQAPAGGGDRPPTDAGDSAPSQSATDPVTTASDAVGTPAGDSEALWTLGDRIAPVITRLRAKRGAGLSFNLSEYALVRVDVSRRSNDARVRKVGTIKRVFGVGPAKLRVKRVGGKVLRPGTYTATLVATDAARNRSRTYTVKFKVVP
jgi:hypothetical protein